MTGIPAEKWAELSQLTCELLSNWAINNEMLRIHFTAQDLARTRFAEGPDVMWEISLSMHQLWLRETHPLLTQWKRKVAHALRPGGPARSKVELPLAINPPRGYFPDFLTPYGTRGFEAGLDAMLSTSKSRLAQEIGLIGPVGSGLVPAITGLAAGEVGALNQLGQAMRDYHDVAIKPVRERMESAVAADLARRVRALAQGGWSEVFSRLHPCAQFDGSVLEISIWGEPTDRDIDLAGEGLLLIPSFFKEARQLMVLADPALPPVLVYPIDPMARAEAEASLESLTALIGRTRADVLAAAELGGTTSTIARQAGVSAPAASKHLSVLRQAGLVLSTREANTVFHTTTPLGRALLAPASPR
jgi:DNA-binding transcriptional ArsR family regulator